MARKKSIINKPIATESFGRKAKNKRQPETETPFDENGFVKAGESVEAAPQGELQPTNPTVTAGAAADFIAASDTTALLISSKGEKAIAKINLFEAETLRELTPEEEQDFADCENEIERGMRSYLGMGAVFFRIHQKKYYLKTHRTFSGYVQERWKFKGGGAVDLIRSYRFWETMKSLPVVPEAREILLVGGEVESAGAPVTAEVVEEKTLPQPADALTDADAPSQRAVDELAKFKKHLEQGDMSAEDFERWTAVATRALFDFIRETTVGEVTQKRIAEVTETLIEIATRKAVEVDGEDRALNAADIQITREQFESVMRDKQAIFEYFEEKRKRLSEPKTRDDLDENKKPSKTLTTVCSEHGEQFVYAILHGAIQVACGCVFGQSGKTGRLIFDKRLTKTNEIAVAELEEFLAKLKQ